MLGGPDPMAPLIRMHTWIEAAVARNTTLLRLAQSAWTTSTPELRRALCALEALARIHLVAPEDVLIEFKIDVEQGKAASPCTIGGGYRRSCFRHVLITQSRVEGSFVVAVFRDCMLHYCSFSCSIDRTHGISAFSRLRPQDLSDVQRRFSTPL